MLPYRPPVEDTMFLLKDVFKIHEDWAKWSQFNEVDLDLAQAILEQGGKFAAEVMGPVSQTADHEGATWRDNEVYAPSGYKEAFDGVVAGGWLSLTGNPEYGGQGLPAVLSIGVEEYFWGANTTLWLYASLTVGAAHCIDVFCDETTKTNYLPPMYEGKWTGAMALTEAHAGTDLGLLRTKATPAEDGSYRVSGTKIFITSGEHDLAENIIHLVLAKLPDAPAGSKGISLFLVPKFLVNDDGTLGARNSFFSASIEEKMGIHGSATSTIVYEDAIGYLVGAPHHGLAGMFVMMNAARLSVGIQGLGAAERAYQMASDYVKERRQGKAVQRPPDAEAEADPIIEHPDIRRLMLMQRAFTEGGRAFALFVAHQIDRSRFAEAPEDQVEATKFVELLTPIAKAFLTDRAMDTTIHAQQCFGGHGYIRETGIEQLVRDTRITQIYEGTNGVQAWDLVRRKVLMNRGEYVADFAEYMRSKNTEGPYKEVVDGYIDEWLECTKLIMERSSNTLEFAAGNAVDYLELSGLVIYAWLWNQMSGVNDEHLNKKYTAEFYFDRILPKVPSLFAAIRNGTDSIQTPESAWF
ncbi:MAG: acyl-CoA dehydrogenase family protein [Gammaproteobacteria bacterium]|nr:acyl-CoA dehydrogenase family protein [Gammaproteobacteria bacterium]